MNQAIMLPLQTHKIRCIEAKIIQILTLIVRANKQMTNDDMGLTQILLLHSDVEW